MSNLKIGAREIFQLLLMNLLTIFKNKLKKLTAMFSNYQLRKATKFSHLEEYKKASKRGKAKDKN